MQFVAYLAAAFVSVFAGQLSPVETRDGVSDVTPFPHPSPKQEREREREVKHSQCHVPVVTVQARTGSLVLFLSVCNVEKRGMHCGSPPSQRRCLPLRRTAATCLVQAIIYLFLSTAKERSSFGSITPAHD